MLSLNHVNLSVPAVAPTVDFFQTVLGFQVVSLRGSNFAILAGEDHFTLTLMYDKSVTDNSYPPTFHLGFLQSTRAAVADLHAKMIAFGVDAPVPAIMRGDTFGFYATIPGGITVEISTTA